LSKVEACFFVGSTSFLGIVEIMNRANISLRDGVKDSNID
jgi:hypothetical protein